ncbi:MAG: ankyrin repeat domain-containing protein, partial [Sedimentisphaerales bacterium]
MFIANGADINSGAGLPTYTPLNEAIEAGHSHLVRMLLSNGADPNSMSGQDRCTPLHLAVCC